MNNYKATIILIAVSFGFFFTYPFRTSFWWGLLSSGFCAAMIGGFADWFGVSALFRKPLGISYRTEIIPRNREKIFNALSDMVGKELLTKENLKQLLSNHNISTILIKFLIENNEKEQLKKTANKVIKDVLWKINPEEAGRVIDKIAKDNLSKIELFYFIERAVAISIENGYDDKIINFILDELIRISNHEQIRALITTLVKETMSTYESGSSRKKVANKIVFDMILRASPSDIAVIIQNKLSAYLKDLKDSSHPMRYKLKDWTTEKIHHLKSDLQFQQKLENWKLEQINSKLDLSKMVIVFISKYIGEGAGESTEFLKLINTINERIDKMMDSFCKNEIWQSEFDAYAKKAMLEFVDNNHSEITIMVRENLDKYSNDMLVNLIESKAGNDLQMIRINGSIVGGLVGLVTFILTFWIG